MACNAEGRGLRKEVSGILESSFPVQGHCNNRPGRRIVFENGKASHNTQGVRYILIPVCGLVNDLNLEFGLDYALKCGERSAFAYQC